MNSKPVADPVTLVVAVARLILIVILSAEASPVISIPSSSRNSKVSPIVASGSVPLGASMVVKDTIPVTNKAVAVTAMSTAVTKKRSIRFVWVMLVSVPCVGHDSSNYGLDGLTYDLDSYWVLFVVVVGVR